ncbi:hypothetical protein PPYR_03748, partial [Photinus pyralis]
MDSEFSCTPPDRREAAKSVAANDLLPEKSKHYYNKIYLNFKEWCQTKCVSQDSENVMLV